MATAAIAGITMFAATAGATVGATTISVGMAAGLGVLAAGAVAAADYFFQPDDPQQAAADQKIQIGDNATPIDKTTMQKSAEVADLDLGELDKEKKKRKKGKGQFKIALDESAAGDDAGTADTGVNVKAPKQLGLQI